MIINTNVSAQTVARQLNESSRLLAKSLARLSSGSKLISAEDDPAGLAVSMRLESQMTRTSACVSNLSNAISFSQTEDGYLKKIGKALDRMSELSVLAQDATKTDTDRGLYDKEFQSLTGYINDTVTKNFNGVSLFSGTTLNITTDADGGTFEMEGISGTYLTNASNLRISSLNDASSALTTVKTAISRLATDRATVGANISRMTATTDGLRTLKENLSAANSRIKDVDVAEESINFARHNIMVQAGIAMLSQANAAARSVLRLLE